MIRKFYNVGDTFVDEESGKTLRCVEGYCNNCFYACKVSYSPLSLCPTAPECRSRCRKTIDSVCFILAELPDSTPITSEILSRNGWSNPFGNINIFKSKDTAFAIAIEEGFACWLKYGADNIGREFTTIGELKAIAKALYKVEIKFE